MRRTVTVSLPEELADELDSLSAREGTSRSEVVRDALRRYFAVQEFRRIRRSLLPEAEAKGLLTDEDVFRQIS
ncbi:MAG: ribbon-helix-helix domain-containing protein [Thermoanaerobaculia bacterium]